MCEAFACLPSQARAELETDAELTVWRILELRAYARMKHTRDAATTAKDMPTGPLADLVGDIEVDLWRARKRRHAE